MIRLAPGPVLPEVKVAVCEPGGSQQDGWLECEVNRNILFSTAALESYAFSKWEPVIFDAMLVAASVEFTDLSCRRPSLGWPRRLSIRVPVADPDRWEAPAVKDSLLDAIEFVTGDHWSIEFLKRTEGLEHPGGDRFALFPPSKAVLAFSEGMDSLAVERFLEALLEQPVRYDFPRLWYTKGETLARWVAIDGDETWRSTKSCWRDSRWSSVRRPGDLCLHRHERRHAGISSRPGLQQPEHRLWIRGDR